MKAWKHMTPRERDALIAEKVLRIPILVYIGDKHPHQGDHQWLDDPANYPHITDNGKHLSYWHEPDTDGVAWSPSADIGAAFLVIHHMRELGWSYAIYDFHKVESGRNLGDHLVCFINHSGSPAVNGHTLEDTICRAALRALGALP